MDEILTVQEVAVYLKVSRSTVWRWCNQGRLLAFKAGHGWRVHRTAVEKMMGRRLRWLEAEEEEWSVNGSQSSVILFTDS